MNDFTPEAMSCLENYNWPGNIRELENKMRRAVLLAESQYVTEDELGIGNTKGNGDTNGLAEKTLKEARSQVERNMILSAMSRYNGNIVKASESLGISRPTMYDLLKKHGIDNP